MLYWLALTALPLLCLLMAAGLLSADAWPRIHRLLGPWLAYLASVPFCYIAGIGIAGRRSWNNVLIDALCAAAIMLAVGVVLTIVGMSAVLRAMLEISVGVFGGHDTIGFFLVSFPAPVVAGAIYGLALHGVHIAVYNEPTLSRSSGRKIHAICGAIAGPIALYSILFISATESDGLGYLLPQDQWARSAAAILYSWAGALPHLYQTGRQLRSDIARGFAPAAGHGSFAFRLFGGLSSALAILAMAVFAH